jgi:hypothetical protein
MQWYWYLLIVVAVIGLGVLKMVVWQKIKDNKKVKAERTHKEED